MSSVTVNGASTVLVSSSFSPSSASFMNTFPLDPRIVSGSVGSIVSAVVTTPFEVVKIKLQYHQPHHHQAAMANSVSYGSTTLLSTTPHRSLPTGTFSMLRHVLANEGVRGVYAGLAPTMIMSIPNYLLYLISYDEIVQVLRKQEHDKTNTGTSSLFLSEASIPLAGGALARLIATTATAPLELLRTRHALPQNISNNSNKQSLGRVWTELSTIVRNDGFAALYRGMAPQLVRDVPFAAIYMLVLERFRHYTKPMVLTQQQGGAATTSSSLRNAEMGFEFANAANAGMIAATLTAPADVVKSRVQSSSSLAAAASSSSNKISRNSNNNKSMMEIASSIVRQEGMAGLWRGNQARMLKVAPQYAIMISFYEVGKKVLATAPTDE